MGLDISGVNPVESFLFLQKIENVTEERRKAIRYFEDNSQELMQQYEGQWVAIFRQEVFVHGRSYKGVLNVLREKGIIGSAYVQFLDPNSRKQDKESELFMRVGV
jgi:hypothetical protein